MKTVYFIRHGECQANADGVLAGSSNDSPLTKKGLEQADAIATKFAGKKIDLIICSPLSRAKDTAERLAEILGYKGEIRVEPLLNERDFGDATGQPLSQGFEAIDAGRVTGIETLEQLAVRMQRALVAFADLPGEHILAVGHGGSERMLYTVYEGKGAESFLKTIALENGGIREYIVEDA